MTTNEIKVIGISGSLRQDSYNRKALRIAEQLALKIGIDVEEIDLKELNLPLYDGDIESGGFPDSVKRMRASIKESDVLLIATPEYNHSVPGGLKNAIDWLSTARNVLDGKVATIFGASTGQFGTMRAQQHLRQILTALNVIILPQPQVFIHSAKESFNPDGSLNDLKVQAQLKELVEKTFQLAKVINRFNSHQTNK